MCTNIVLEHKQDGDFNTFRQDVLGRLGIDPEMEAAFFNEARPEEVNELFFNQFLEFYTRKFQRMSEMLLPQIKQVYENEGDRYKRILIPFTDGRPKQMPIAAEIEDAVKSNGKSIPSDIEKVVTLAVIDEKWKTHLRAMDELKEASQAASFEQKDPLVIYKMEAFNLFEQLIHEINEEVTAFLAKGKLDLPQGPDQQLREARRQRTDMSKTKTSRTSDEEMARRAAESVSQGSSKPETIRRHDKKVGRNEPCPCGSGKKYKHCHGRK
jgi:preprotein translocase subunit SecA